MGLRRFELLTSPLSGVRSNQLSYRPARATAGLKAAGGVSQLRRKHKRPVALSVSPVMKGHEDDGNVLWKTAKLFQAQGPALSRNILRKEVIQPQVPLRLPCYDFIPVADPTVARCLQRLAHDLRVKPTPMM